MTKVPDGPWYYEQLELGLNYRMNDVQALGLSQMSRLDEFVEQRHYINRYDELLSDSIVETPKVFKDSISSWHLYNKTKGKQKTHIGNFLKNLEQPVY